MRRAVAIVLTVCLLGSTALPLWASTCAAMKATPMCHRMAEQHHCDMMEQQDDSAGREAVPVMSSRPGYCPMHCCLQSGAGTSIAIATPPGAIVLPVFHNRIYFHSPTFTTSGFSSHTDRGPPLA